MIKMIDLNYLEFLLIWGIYSVSVLMSILCGYYLGLSKKQKNAKQ